MPDHDQRMKVAVREFLPESQALLLPDWTGRFDLSTPEWQQQEVFLDPPQGERRFLDLIALVGLLQPVEESSQTLLHVEIESGDSVAELRRRMPRYRSALTSRRDVSVLSLALYLSVGLEGRGWDEARVNYWEANLEVTRWAYLGLPALDALAYVEGDNLLGVSLSVLMRCPDERKAWLKARALQRVSVANLTAYRRFLLMEIIEAYLPLVGPHLEEYERLLLTEDFKMVRVLGQTTFEKGFEKGEVQGQRLQMRRMLEDAFGPLGETARGRLESLSAEDLFELGKKFRAAKTLAELGLDEGTNGTAPTATP
jgi:hypothetical protein